MSGELERFDPAEQAGRLYYEHLHRYALSREYVAGKRVLDLGCGTGYGSAILADVAAHVTGVDLDNKAIQTARKRYGGAQNLHYLCADCYGLPFDDGSFDVVVANEMIEHVEDHDALIVEALRVLDRGGLLIVSTPNRPVYNRYKPPNIFHVSEMDVPEFSALLHRYFKHVHMTGTRMALVSIGFALDGPEHSAFSGDAQIYQGTLPANEDPGIQNGGLRLADPEYVLAICSQQEVNMPEQSSSLFYSYEDDLWQEHEKIMAWASGLHDEDEALRADLARTRSEMDSRNAMLAGARQENDTLQARVADLRDVSQAATEALDQQKQAVGQQTEMISRLLGKVAGTPVASDHIAVIEALFDLQIKLIEQNARIAKLDEVERQLVEARRAAEADGARAAKLDAEVSALRTDLAELTDERARLNRELEDMRRAAAPKRDAMRDEDEQMRAARQRFAKMHQLVRAQLTDAPRKLPGRIPETKPEKKSWKQKLFANAAPFRTALFDSDWIARQHPHLPRLSLGEIVGDSQYHGIDPHPLFAAREYLERNFDVAAAGMSPLQHYILHGWRENRNPHRYFANDWYLQQNPDVLAAGRNPLDHYLRFGWREGRWPNPVFDPRAYLDRYPDVDQADIEPLTHYATHGHAEGREPQFRGLDINWRHFIPPERRTMPLMDYLMYEQAAEISSEASEPTPFASAQAGGFPFSDTWPSPLANYWPPQGLRDFIIEGYGEEPLALYWYLLSVMETFHGRPDDFSGSNACNWIVEHLLLKANQKAVPMDGAPDASIIVPVYNNIIDTLLCLVAVLESNTRYTFEIIVADDGSTDTTSELIRNIGGAVRHLRQPRNLGFLGNCNAAAEQARGRHIVLLNNDTLVMPGWLDHLLAPFDTFDRVGLTGSKLINSDGSLQEAGGIFWNDGSAWNFGRGQDARAPEFCYLRDVDYCSGASIAIPTVIWRQVGGFDPLFTPAYCEDSDLAFRLRDAGFRTLYAPASEVIHHEGRSHGRDLSSGVKAYQVTNQQLLRDRWQDTLECEHYPNGKNVLRARDRSRNKRHVLIVDHYVPQWDRDAGSRTIRQFIDTLLDDGWSVTFWPDNLFRDPNYTPDLQSRGVEVIFGSEFVGGFAKFLRDRKGLYDSVLLSRPHISEKYLDDIRKLTDARIVYYGHDVHFQRMIAQRENGDNSVDSATIEHQRQQELAVCNRSDAILYPSREEAELMGGLVSAKVLSMPIAAYSFRQTEIDDARAALTTLGERQSDVANLLFVGGFAHRPNSDGIIWFCQEIVPALRRAGIDFRLRIVGSNPGVDIWALEADDIEVLGFVSDARLAELYRETAAVVAPLRYGAGVKGKVVEAMAQGVPTATTSVGAQGLDGAEEYLFIGDTAEALAQAVLAALNSEQAEHRAAAALDYVQNHFSITAVKTALRTAFAVTS